MEIIVYGLTIAVVVMAAIVAYSRDRIKHLKEESTDWMAELAKGLPVVNDVVPESTSAASSGLDDLNVDEPRDYTFLYEQAQQELNRHIAAVKKKAQRRRMAFRQARRSLS